MGCGDDLNPIRVISDVATLGAAETIPIPGSGNLASQVVGSTFSGDTGTSSNGVPADLSNLSDKELQQLQVDALRRNAKYEEDLAAQQKELEPYTLSQVGLKRDETGKLVPDTESTSYQSQQVTKAANERTLKAFAGNLDVDPSVEADIARGESQVKEELRRRLGPGAEGGDIWNRALAEFNRQANSLRYSVRHGEMTSADAIASNRENEALRRQNQYYTQQTGGADVLSTLAGRTGSMSEAALRRNQAGVQFGQDLAFRRDQLAAQGAGALTSGLLSAGGTIIGASLAG